MTDEPRATSTLSDLDRRFLWHPYTRRSALEVDALPMIVRGEGIYLQDHRGRRYLDAISSWWCCNLGHGRAEIVRAIQNQAAELQHSILGNLSHPRAVELAASLAALFADTRRHVHFASDGASAVEAALKIALQYWHNRGESRKTRLVSLREGYHGDTLAALSLGFLDAFHRPFASVRLPCLQLPVPPYDATEEEALAAAAKLFAGHEGELAALVVEPMCQGAAGMRIYSAAFLKGLHALCRKHGALLIADEIAMGFGRTGSLFAFEHAGVDPDLVCLGKGLTGGYLPLSAVIARDEIYDAFTDQPVDRTFYHGHTFAGNPIASAAALAALQIYRKENLAERARDLGRELAGWMREIESLPGVKDVRSLGLVAAVELAGTPQGGSPHMRAARVRDLLRDRGILLRPLGGVIYLMPPLVIEAPGLRRLVEELAEAVKVTD